MSLPNIFMEVQIDSDQLAIEIANKLNTTEFVSLIKEVLHGYADLNDDEAVFIGVLEHMISMVESCTGEYSGTKWEMLPAMKGLLDNK